MRRPEDVRPRDASLACLEMQACFFGYAFTPFYLFCSLLTISMDSSSRSGRSASGTVVWLVWMV